MSNIAFDPDIKKMFAPYVAPMLKVSIATPEGTFSLDLSNYESVCRLSNRIKIAIEGYQKDENGNYVYDEDGDPISTVGHPMPPIIKDSDLSGPMKIEDIDTYNKWLADGMPETVDGTAYSGPIV
ncbi:MAG: hypothetical protein JXR03_02915 [Cyclobacteriaceae bacterium]